jgi:hypothetical protein
MPHDNIEDLQSTFAHSLPRKFARVGGEDPEVEQEVDTEGLEVVVE